MADSAARVPMSSIRRPTVQIVRSLRRHRPSRSAGDGSCNRPGARAYGGKYRPAHAPHCAAAGPPRWNNQHNSVTMRASWAVCRDPHPDLPGSKAWNPPPQIIVPQFAKYQCFARRCSKASMDDSVCHVYVSLCRDDGITWRLRNGAASFVHLRACGGKGPN